MTELPATGLAVTSYQVLAGIASVLLVFVSAGVIYLSAAEWRDRRRRRAAETEGGRSGRSGRPARQSSARADRPSPRSSTAFGRRP
ncbi:MAG: hypothetical protein AB1Z22_04280 [Synechococcaceae cyanobacterium]